MFSQMRASATALCLMLCHASFVEANEAGPDRFTMPDRHVLGRAPDLEPRIVLLSMVKRFPQQAWREVEQVAAEELRAAGLEVRTRDAVATTSDTRLAELGAQAAAHKALAAVRIVREAQRSRVQIWIYDALTQKMVLRRAESTGPDASAGRQLALKAVELLNASLIEIRMRREQPIRNAPIPVEKMVSERLDRQERAMWRVSVGPAFVNAPGGLGTALGLTPRLSWYGRPWLGLHGEAFLPLTRSDVTHPTGRADLAPFLLRALLLVEPWPHWRLSPAAGLGVGTVLLMANGSSASLLSEQTDWGTAFLGSLRLELVWHVHPAIHVLGAFSASLALPELVVHFGEQVVGEGGRPLLDASLAVGWQW